MYYLLLITSIISFCLYKRHTIKKFFNRKKQQIDLLLSVVNMLKQSIPADNQLLIPDRGNCANIAYKYGSLSFNINLPFKRKNVMNMMDIRAVLKRYDSNDVDITQQPGFPYLVSARDLGGDKIILTNENTGLSYEYIEAPYYGEEIWEQE